MYKQKIHILIHSEFDMEKVLDEYETLLGNYCKSGQIQGIYETPFISNNEIISYQTTMETDSLTQKYNDEYVTERIKNLESWCNSKLNTEVVGHSIPLSKDACTCKKSEYFILFTHAFSESSPINCGTCNKSIPLYRLSNLAYEDRFNILSWEDNYKACDNLQLRCTVGEKWATRQMSDSNSELSREGIEICNTIKEKTGIDTYYYLYNYRFITSKQDSSRKCPSCSNDWLLKKQLHNFYDFKCDQCHLLSSFTTNTR